MRFRPLITGPFLYLVPGYACISICILRPVCLQPNSDLPSQAICAANCVNSTGGSFVLRRLAHLGPLTNTIKSHILTWTFHLGAFRNDCVTTRLLLHRPVCLRANSDLCTLQANCMVNCIKSKRGCFVVRQLAIRGP
jgi:hypothetical protein